MIGLLIAMVGVCFGAKFDSKEAEKLLKEKDYVKLQQYLQTNNEYDAKYKAIYNRYAFIVRIMIKKDVNKSNILSLVKQEIKEGKLDCAQSVNLLLMSRVYIPELRQNYEFARLTKQFYEENKTQKYGASSHNAICSAYIHLKEFDNLLNFLNSLQENKISNVTCTMVNKSLKNFTTEQQINYFGMVSKNPTKFIRTANDLILVIQQASKITDTKYDAVMKELYTKLNRAFYSKIVESDTWKQALVNLQLIMKPYNL